MTGNIAPKLTPSTAPAQDAIHYEVKKFHRGFGDKKTVYQGDPSPEVDKVWKSLYNGRFRLFYSTSPLMHCF